MSRIYVHDEGQDDPEVCSLPIDLCRKCWVEREEVVNTEHGGNSDPEPDDPIGANHTPYEDCFYRCDGCNEVLTKKDN